MSEGAWDVKQGGLVVLKKVGVGKLLEVGNVWRDVRVGVVCGVVLGWCVRLSWCDGGACWWSADWDCGTWLGACGCWCGCWLYDGGHFGDALWVVIVGG